MLKAKWSSPVPRKTEGTQKKNPVAGKKRVQELPFKEGPRVSVHPFLTCLQQQLDNGEVGVGHTVVKGCVSVSISQVDKQL